MAKIHNIIRLIDRRKELRINPTPEEKTLWWYLKDERLGIKFRRQHSVGGYILDFYCTKNKLIIELDGEIHNTKEGKEYDQVRDKFFMGLGYVVLRFPNREVRENINEVLRKIKSYL